MSEERGARIDELLDRHDFDAALVLVEEAIVAEPGQYLHHCRLARIHLATRRPDLAQEAAERAMAVDPERELPHRLRSVALQHQGRHEDAVLAARVSLGMNPEEPMCHLTLIDALLQAGRVEEAGAASAAAADAFPESSPVLRRRGLALLQLGETDDAMEVLYRGLVANPDDAAIHMLLGQIAEHHGELDMAANHFAAAGRSGAPPPPGPGWAHRLVSRVGAALAAPLRPFLRRAAVRRARKLPPEARSVIEGDADG